MPTLADMLAPWQGFYTLLGTAAATMIGLLFVAATVGAGVFSSDRRAPLRVFLSASVVNFGLLLAASLVILAPVRSWLLFGVLILGCGVFGLAHCLLACRDTLRDGLIRSLDLEDRAWYIALPIVGYLCLIASGITLVLRSNMAWIALAVSMGLLLAIGIHNAWDITVWSMTRRKN